VLWQQQSFDHQRRLAVRWHLTGRLRELAGGIPNGTIILPPSGVGVFRIEGAGPGQ